MKKKIVEGCRIKVDLYDIFDGNDIETVKDKLEDILYNELFKSGTVSATFHIDNNDNEPNVYVSIKRYETDDELKQRLWDNPEYQKYLELKQKFGE